MEPVPASPAVSVSSFSSSFRTSSSISNKPGRLIFAFSRMFTSIGHQNHVITVRSGPQLLLSLYTYQGLYGAPDDSRRRTGLSSSLFLKDLLLNVSEKVSQYFPGPFFVLFFFALSHPGTAERQDRTFKRRHISGSATVLPMIIEPSR